MENLNHVKMASWLTIILGAWLMLSPIWISITGAALTSLLITGAVFILAGLSQLYWENTWPSMVIGLAALWLFISAFAFSVSNAVVWNQVLSAIIGFVLATWDGFEMTEFHQHHGAV